MKQQEIIDNKVIIVTEGRLDAEIIKKLLSDTDIKFDLYAGDGFSSALSTARSLLINGQQPICLILDTDSVEEAQMEERKRFASMYFGNSNSHLVSIIWAEPEFEIIFTENRNILGQLVNKNISDDVWELAKNSPRKAIEILTHKSRTELFHSFISEKGHRDALRRTSLARQLFYVLQKKEKVFTFSNSNPVKRFSIKEKDAFLLLRRIIIPSLIGTNLKPDEWSNQLRNLGLSLKLSCTGNGEIYEHGEIIIDSLVSPYHRNPVFDKDVLLPPQNGIKYSELKIEITSKSQVPYMVNLLCDVMPGIEEINISE